MGCGQSVSGPGLVAPMTAANVEHNEGLSRVKRAHSLSSSDDGPEGCGVVQTIALTDHDRESAKPRLLSYLGADAGTTAEDSAQSPNNSGSHAIVGGAADSSNSPRVNEAKSSLQQFAFGGSGSALPCKRLILSGSSFASSVLPNNAPTSATSEPLRQQKYTAAAARAGADVGGEGDGGGDDPPSPPSRLVGGLRRSVAASYSFADSSEHDNDNVAAVSTSNTTNNNNNNGAPLRSSSQAPQHPQQHANSQSQLSRSHHRQSSSSYVRAHGIPSGSCHDASVSLRAIGGLLLLPSASEGGGGGGVLGAEDCFDNSVAVEDGGGGVGRGATASDLAYGGNASGGAAVPCTANGISKGPAATRRQRRRPAPLIGPYAVPANALTNTNNHHSEGATTVAAAPAAAEVSNAAPPLTAEETEVLRASAVLSHPASPTGGLAVGPLGGSVGTCMGRRISLRPNVNAATRRPSHASPITRSAGRGGEGGTEEGGKTTTPGDDGRADGGAALLLVAFPPKGTDGAAVRTSTAVPAAAGDASSAAASPLPSPPLCGRGVVEGPSHPMNCSDDAASYYYGSPTAQRPHALVSHVALGGAGGGGGGAAGARGGQGESGTMPLGSNAGVAEAAAALLLNPSSALHSSFGFGASGGGAASSGGSKGGPHALFGRVPFPLGDGASSPTGRAPASTVTASSSTASGAHPSRWGGGGDGSSTGGHHGGIGVDLGLQFSSFGAVGGADASFSPTGRAASAAFPPPGSDGGISVPAAHANVLLHASSANAAGGAMRFGMGGVGAANGSVALAHSLPTTVVAAGGGADSAAALGALSPLSPLRGASALPHRLRVAPSLQQQPTSAAGRRSSAASYQQSDVMPRRAVSTDAAAALRPALGPLLAPPRGGGVGGGPHSHSHSPPPLLPPAPSSIVGGGGASSPNGWALAGAAVSPPSPSVAGVEMGASAAAAALNGSAIVGRRLSNAVSVIAEANAPEGTVSLPHSSHRLLLRPIRPATIGGAPTASPSNRSPFLAPTPLTPSHVGALSDRSGGGGGGGAEVFGVSQRSADHSRGRMSASLTSISGVVPGGAAAQCAASSPRRDSSCESGGDVAVRSSHPHPNLHHPNANAPHRLRTPSPAWSPSASPAASPAGSLRVGGGGGVSARGWSAAPISNNLRGAPTVGGATIVRERVRLRGEGFTSCVDRRACAHTTHIGDEEEGLSNNNTNADGYEMASVASPTGVASGGVPRPYRFPSEAPHATTPSGVPLHVNGDEDAHAAPPLSVAANGSPNATRHPTAFHYSTSNGGAADMVGVGGGAMAANANASWRSPRRAALPVLGDGASSSVAVSADASTTNGTALLGFSRAEGGRGSGVSIVNGGGGDDSAARVHTFVLSGASSPVLVAQNRSGLRSLHASHANHHQQQGGHGHGSGVLLTPALSDAQRSRSDRSDNGRGLNNGGRAEAAEAESEDGGEGGEANSFYGNNNSNVLTIGGSGRSATLIVLPSHHPTEPSGGTTVASRFAIAHSIANPNNPNNPNANSGAAHFANRLRGELSENRSVSADNRSHEETLLVNPHGSNTNNNNSTTHNSARAGAGSSRALSHIASVGGPIAAANATFANNANTLLCAGTALINDAPTVIEHERERSIGEEEEEGEGEGGGAAGRLGLCLPPLCREDCEVMDPTLAVSDRIRMGAARAQEAALAAAFPDNMALIARAQQMMAASQSMGARSRSDATNNSHSHSYGLLGAGGGGGSGTTSQPTNWSGHHSQSQSHSQPSAGGYSPSPRNSLGIGGLVPFATVGGGSVDEKDANANTDKDRAGPFQSHPLHGASIRSDHGDGIDGPTAPNRRRSTRAPPSPSTAAAAGANEDAVHAARGDRNNSLLPTLRIEGSEGDHGVGFVGLREGAGGTTPRRCSCGSPSCASPMTDERRRRSTNTTATNDGGPQPSCTFIGIGAATPPSAIAADASPDSDAFGGQGGGGSGWHQRERQQFSVASLLIHQPPSDKHSASHSGPQPRQQQVAGAGFRSFTSVGPLVGNSPLFLGPAAGAHSPHNSARHHHLQQSGAGPHHHTTGGGDTSAVSYYFASSHLPAAVAGDSHSSHRHLLLAASGAHGVGSSVAMGGAPQSHNHDERHKEQLSTNVSSFPRSSLLLPSPHGPQCHTPGSPSIPLNPSAPARNGGSTAADFVMPELGAADVAMKGGGATAGVFPTACCLPHPPPFAGLSAEAAAALSSATALTMMPLLLSTSSPSASATPERPLLRGSHVTDASGAAPTPQQQQQHGHEMAAPPSSSAPSPTCAGLAAPSSPAGGGGGGGGPAAVMRSSLITRGPEALAMHGLCVPTGSGLRGGGMARDDGMREHAPSGLSLTATDWAGAAPAGSGTAYSQLFANGHASPFAASAASPASPVLGRPIADSVAAGAQATTVRVAPPAGLYGRARIIHRVSAGASLPPAPHSSVVDLDALGEYYAREGDGGGEQRKKEQIANSQVVGGPTTTTTNRRGRSSSRVGAAALVNATGDVPWESFGAVAVNSDETEADAEG